MNQDEMNPGRVRRDLYAYLESQGLQMTEERHKIIKNAVVLHTIAMTEKLQGERNNAISSLNSMGFPPKLETMEKRIKSNQCVVCGINLKKEAEYEYSAPCGHFPKGMRILFA